MTKTGLLGPGLKFSNLETTNNGTVHRSTINNFYFLYIILPLHWHFAVLWGYFVCLFYLFFILFFSCYGYSLIYRNLFYIPLHNGFSIFSATFLSLFCFLCFIPQLAHSFGFIFQFMFQLILFLIGLYHFCLLCSAGHYFVLVFFGLFWFCLCVCSPLILVIMYLILYLPFVCICFFCFLFCSVFCFSVFVLIPPGGPQMVKNLPAMQETQVWSQVGKMPWRREWQPTLAFLPRKSHE